MNKKKLGFTLAEVLIVIGIIGVVAALTLPNLNHATGDKERVTKVKKIYSSLTEAFDRAQAIYGDHSTWYNDGIQNWEKPHRFAKRVTEFMKISKDCGTSTGQGCFNSGNYKSWTGVDQGRSYDSVNFYKVLTSDGMSIAFEYGGYIDIIVDIDGPNKGPYTFGKDLFEFAASAETNLLYPMVCDYVNDTRNWFTSYKISNGQACWIINFDNADYLKADSSGKCNDSNIVLDGVTNTSCH